MRRSLLICIGSLALALTAEAQMPYNHRKAPQRTTTNSGYRSQSAVRHVVPQRAFSPARYRQRYGEQGVEANGRHSFFGAIVFDAPKLARIRDLASSIPDARVRAAQDSLAVLVPFLDTLLEFRVSR